MYAPPLYRHLVAVASLVAASATTVTGGAQDRPSIDWPRSLSVRLTAPSGGTSLGNVNLDTSPRDLVIAAPPMSFTKVTILYTFKPTVLAGVIPVSSRTVTFTLATYP